MANKLGIKIDELLRMYEVGKTPTEIAEYYGCSLSNITRRLKKAGINFIRDYSKDRRVRTNRHKVDTTFFKEIDTEEKAYFLGMMMADGSVGTTKTQFYLKLKDEDVIVKFKEALKCDYSIRHHNNPCNYILQVSCQELIDDLIKWGCTPNKTHTLQLPKIKENLMHHFIRGFMDGDGCIRVGKTRSTDYFDIVSASKVFIEQLREVLLPYTSHIGISKETKYDVWHIRCAGKQVKFLLDWIYKDATIYMQRKFFKYQLLSSSKIG